MSTSKEVDLAHEQLDVVGRPTLLFRRRDTGQVARLPLFSEAGWDEEGARLVSSMTVEFGSDEPTELPAPTLLSPLGPIDGDDIKALGEQLSDRGFVEPPRVVYMRRWIEIDAGACDRISLQSGNGDVGHVHIDPKAVQCQRALDLLNSCIVPLGPFKPRMEIIVSTPKPSSD